MSRTRFPTLLLMTAGVAAISLAPQGCAENRSTLYIVGVLAKTSDCTVTFDPGQPRIGRGLMDTLVSASQVAPGQFETTAYSPPVLIGNQMVPQGSPDQLRTETSRIDLRGAEVALEAVGGSELVRFSTTASGSLNPSPSSTPGFFGSTVMMSPPAMNLEDGEYLAKVRVFGVTLGGQDVETGEFHFPIQVCSGCSLSFSAESLAAGQCIPGDEASLCRPGQDGPTDCSVCMAIRGPNDPRCHPG